MENKNEVWVVLCNKQVEYAGSVDGALEWVKQGMITDLSLDAETDKYQIVKVNQTPWWD